MSDNRVSGLASAFENPTKQTAKPPSAVSSIASRFETPSQTTSDAAHVSAKLSGIASRFGTTVAEEPPKRPTALSPPPPRPAAPRDAPAPPPVEAVPAATFSDIHRRFATGAVAEREQPVEEPPNMFASAASAFRKREEETKEPVESKVSQFTRSFESGGARAPEPVSKPPVIPGKPVERELEERVVEGVAANVRNITSRFEGGIAPPTASEETKAQPPSLTDRFTDATKLFDSAKKTEEVVDEDPGSLKNRFADASKLFGGDAK